jgi:hypothetical protein
MGKSATSHTRNPSPGAQLTGDPMIVADAAEHRFLVSQFTCQAHCNEFFGL